MASVPSLDQDLRGLRLDKYSPKLANEAREWIEEVLGERLRSGDLLEALKDGIALCKLMNLAIGAPGLRYKESSMPFVQMENISHFLKACQNPPISLPPHDVFLTVDLYESKDPAQVLQCLSAFSRRASIIQPARFQRAMGKTRAGVVSPQTTGTSTSGYSGGSKAKYIRDRGISNASDSVSSTFDQPTQPASGRLSPTKRAGTASPAGGVTSWSKKADEGATMPAWNIAQYGYMGGASQGNMGITFGGRRQITTPAPKIPNLAEKERKRREEQAEAERSRVLSEEAEAKQRVEREAEEEREKIAEEKRWEEETKKQKERERLEAAKEKLRWGEEERRWKEEEAKEKELEARLESERQSIRVKSDLRLKGQFLSQYQAEQQHLSKTPEIEDPARIAERERVKDLERQLEEAKKREQEYERERQERFRQGSLGHGNAEKEKEQENTPPLHADVAPSRISSEGDSWQADERDYLGQAWKESSGQAPPKPPRPLPIPKSTVAVSTSSQEQPIALPPWPLPNPSTYTPTISRTISRTDRYLHTSSPPLPTPHATHVPPEASHSTTSEQDSETARRLASQQKTKAGGWASKSLLEREMERERERQREWEESQKVTKDAVQRGVKDGGSGPGESWDVNQYGYMGGDSQNRGGPGLGGRRQILGPRPKP